MQTNTKNTFTAFLLFQTFCFTLAIPISSASRIASSPRREYPAALGLTTLEKRQGHTLIVNNEGNNGVANIQDAPGVQVAVNNQGNGGQANIANSGSQNQVNNQGTGSSQVNPNSTSQNQVDSGAPPGDCNVGGANPQVINNDGNNAVQNIQAQPGDHITVNNEGNSGQANITGFGGQNVVNNEGNGGNAQIQ